MLSRDPEGRVCLEDGEGRVRLDMTDAVSVWFGGSHFRYLERAYSLKGAWY